MHLCAPVLPLVSEVTSTPGTGDIHTWHMTGSVTSWSTRTTIPALGKGVPGAQRQLVREFWGCSSHPWMRPWLGCGRVAPSAASWLLQPGRNRTEKLRHGAVPMELSHLIPRDEQLHRTEAGNLHPPIPSGSRIVSVNRRMHPGSHCIPARLHPTGSSSGCGGVTFPSSSQRLLGDLGTGDTALHGC